ncbi:MAG: hypothetical protein J1F63_06725 [Oscillospiraceae bacterium]|nr:hypothetical protein [Oscillospiraceae bacterium]
MLQRIIALVLVLCLAAVPAMAEENEPETASVTLGNAHGYEIALDMTIDNVRIVHSENGEELAELRKLAEALNYIVEWNAETGYIRLINPFGEAELTFLPESDECSVLARTSYENIFAGYDLGIDSYTDTASKAAVGGVTYVSLDFLREYLYNYNDVPISELDFSTEFPLLDGRLRVKMPERTMYGRGSRLSSSIMGAYDRHGSETTMHLVMHTGEHLTVSVDNVYSFSVGDMKKDAENLGGIISEGAEEYTVNDLTLLDLEVKGCPKAALIKASDGRLYTVYVQMNELAFSDEKAAVELAQKIISSLSGDSAADRHTVRGWVFDVDDDFDIVYDIGIDFDVTRIIKIAPSDKENLSLGIYWGYFPSTDEGRLAENALSVVRGTFLGSEIKWYITKDGDMEAIMQYGIGYFHLFARGMNFDERHEFIDVVSKIRAADPQH